MPDLGNCPSCNATLKSGIFGGNKLLNKNEVEIINEMYGQKSDAYCNACSSEKLQIAIHKLHTEETSIRQTLMQMVSYIPVVSAPNPYQWEYTVLGMVTGQSTTGTGVLSELGASVADIFGGQSAGFNTKLKAGENMCFMQLRQQTVNFGGNAVISTDIDFSEVGGDRGMLMVCMSGTAIRLHNIEVLSEIAVKSIRQISPVQERLKLLDRLKRENK